jgi:aminoglycoside phosphotransferase (APT) family kinase protein
MSTVPQLREDDTTRQSLTLWFSAQRPQCADVAVSELARPQTAGGSNETLLTTVSWTERGEPRTREVVVRVAPTAMTVFLDARFAQQYRVLDTLGRCTDIPVPEMMGFESDESVLGSPFWVMSRIHGEAPSDFPPYNQQGFLVEASPAERERLWCNAVETLAAIHRVPATLFDFLAEPDRGESGLDQLLSYWRQSLQWASDPYGDETLESVYDWLAGHLPASTAPGLSWGDARIGNMLFDNWRCVAVVDWEMVSLGGPLVDLGWWLFLDQALGEDIGLKRLDGLGSHADTISLWQEHTGLQAADMRWYETFAGFRLGAILLRAQHLRQSLGIPVPAPGEFGSLYSLTCKLAASLDFAEPRAERR